MLPVSLTEGEHGTQWLWDNNAHREKWYFSCKQHPYPATPQQQSTTVTTSSPYPTTRTQELQPSTSTAPASSSSSPPPAPKSQASHTNHIQRCTSSGTTTSRAPPSSSPASHDEEFQQPSTPASCHCDAQVNAQGPLSAYNTAWSGGKVLE